MIKLSIIIPCYNAGEYIHELLDILAPQITDECEVIIIDDGSDEPFKTDYDFTVIRQQNGGASKARNVGLDTAKGEYIAFLDADDLISNKYVDTILNKAKKEKFDYCYLSWKAFGGWNMDVKDEDGKTPLMYAAAHNKNPDVAEALIKAGADINAKDSNGKTSLMYAKERKTDVGMADVLIKSISFLK